MEVHSARSSLRFFVETRTRGYSSVGRASALQAECLRFESACLHSSEEFGEFAAKAGRDARFSSQKSASEIGGV